MLYWLKGTNNDKSQDYCCDITKHTHTTELQEKSSISSRIRSELSSPVLVKAFTAGINVHSVFRAGGPWSQVMSS